MKRGIVSICLLAFAPALFATTLDAAGIDWEADSTNSFLGHIRHVKKIAGCEAWVTAPLKPAPGNPWVWCTEWPTAFTERTGSNQLVEDGFYHLHIVVGTECYGSPEALRQMDAFYQFFTSKGLAKKGCLTGVSRGGLYAYRFAAQHPERVTCIYGDAPVCDLKCWPLNLNYGAPASQEQIDRFLGLYGFKDLKEALLYHGNPVDVLPVLANAKIPLVHVIGLNDSECSPDYNTGIVEFRYRQLGGTITVFRKVPDASIKDDSEIPADSSGLTLKCNPRNCGHHPHGLKNPWPVVRLIEQYAKPSAAYPQNAAVAKALEPFIASNLLSGAVAVTVDRKGESTVTSVGWRDTEKKTPMTQDSFFWIASMSKSFCALSVMMLADEGRLNVDDPVSKYIPEFDNLWVRGIETNNTLLLMRPERPVTIRMLLTHTSGLNFLAPFQTGNGLLGCLPLEQLIQAYAQAPLNSQPGTKTRYSNEGINTAARIVEIVSGMTYDVFVQKRIFDPLGMKNATFFPSEKQMRRFVQLSWYDALTHAYRADNGRQKAIKPWRLHPAGDFPEAGGGIFATGDDLRRYVQLYLDKGVFEGKRLISEKSIEQIHLDGFACRWNGTFFGHDGAYRTEFRIYPREGIALVWLVQADSSEWRIKGVFDALDAFAAAACKEAAK